MIPRQPNDERQRSCERNAFFTKIGVGFWLLMSLLTLLGSGISAWALPA